MQNSSRFKISARRIKKGVNTKPGRPGFRKIDKFGVKLSVAA